MAVEFVRLPDAHLGYLFLGFVTMGQTLSLPMVIGGAAWAAWLIAKQRKAQAG
ncbi:MAG: prolipoprotein diacylglyceryl transferase, partial [SAR324 cluster bacterium]|nr:prolipoprotein diacylglyceryl transferase [SAR324 cluster bacterium]